MKKLRFLGMATMVAIMSVGLGACGEDNSQQVVQEPETPEEPYQFNLHVKNAGDLPTLMSKQEQQEVESLSLSGSINGTDVEFIRSMPNLIKIDLSKAYIVSGGDSYYDYADTKFYTSDNVFPEYFFYEVGEHLEEVKMPNDITKVGKYAFGDCLSLTSITIPNSVTTIGESAFSDCTNLTSITIPNSVTEIDEGAFSGSGLVSISIPNSVTEIKGVTFSDCASLTSINIPSSVTKIGYDAFSFCTNLTSITIPNSVTEIEGYAFCECTGLASINIPSSVTIIGEEAFYFCKSLTSITIPSSVTEIGDGAFYGCSILKEVHMKSSTPPYTDDAGFDADNATLYIPVGSVDNYRKDSYWRQFNNIVEE